MSAHQQESAEGCNCDLCLPVRRWIRGVAFAVSLQFRAKKIRERADKLACEITEQERFCYYMKTGRHYGDMLDAQVRRATQAQVNEVTAVYVANSTFYTGEA